MKSHNLIGNIFNSPHLLDSWREFLIKPPHIWHDDTSRLVTECMIGFRQNLKLSDNYWNCDFSLTPCLSQHVFPICSLILYHFTIDHGYPWYTGMTYNGFSVKFWNWNIWARDKRDAILQTTFSNAISWKKMFDFRLKFHRSLFLNVQLTIFQHWFR